MAARLKGTETSSKQKIKGKMEFTENNNTSEDNGKFSCINIGRRKNEVY